MYGYGSMDIHGYPWIWISMDIHRKSVDMDMDMDMDVKFHIHGNPGRSVLPKIECVVCAWAKPFQPV